MTLTFETLLEARRRVLALGPVPPPISVTFSPHCLRDTEERLFPYSKHRSRRIWKKLVKRHGGEFRRIPAMFLLKDQGLLVAHPAFQAQINEMWRKAEHSAIANANNWSFP